MKRRLDNNCEDENIMENIEGFEKSISSVCTTMKIK